MSDLPPLYQWQKEAISIWEYRQCNLWPFGDERAYGIKDVVFNEDATIAAVTGSGKTRVALEIMSKVQAQTLPIDTLYITIIVPRKPLMIQWRDDLLEWGYSKVIIGRIGGGSIKGWPNKPTTTYALNINIVTIQSMARGKGDFIPREVDDNFRYMNADGDWNTRQRISLPDNVSHFVVVDECHNLRGQKMRNSLSEENCPRDKVLGLSATPHPNRSAKLVVESLCGPIRYSYRYAQALADGVIPSFRLHAIQVPLDINETSTVALLTDKITGLMRKSRHEWGVEAQRLLKMAKDLGTRRKRVLNRCRSRFPMALRILNHHGVDAPTLLFHESTEDVDRLSQMTQYLNPAIYHSNRPDKDAELERFKDAETNHLFSCLSLTEGFNVPRVKVAIMMSGPNAPLRRIQTLGRCLRGNGETPNEIYFLYVAGTKDEEGLHNLLEAGDIPQMIEVGDERIQVVHHYKMGSEWIDEIEAPVNQKIEW